MDYRLLVVKFSSPIGSDLCEMVVAQPGKKRDEGFCKKCERFRFAIIPEFLFRLSIL
ncbi:hypothetical protein Krac_2137 [Ktedonobacter racemifer DSM 44963]|uniref:Uncharacterized protein n=1 Tax=Ktedonobacter racemifer DSM 44963 TaxID=485913 RepID=D6U4I7_KTERA|nr:hypothetical protein Krac_2137 [Ktedonobacter racemifer DSM 44963]